MPLLYSSSLCHSISNIPRGNAPSLTAISGLRWQLRNDELKCYFAILLPFCEDEEIKITNIFINFSMRSLTGNKWPLNFKVFSNKKFFYNTTLCKLCSLIVTKKFKYLLLVFNIASWFKLNKIWLTLVLKRKIPGVLK